MYGVTGSIVQLVSFLVYSNLKRGLSIYMVMYMKYVCIRHIITVIIEG